MEYYSYINFTLLKRVRFNDYPASWINLLLNPEFCHFYCLLKDKRASIKGNWRTQKNVTHTCFLGGWPGALLAQHLFRHKTSKFRFQFVFWLLVALNCIGTVLIQNPDFYM
ncbi:DUF1294 domain-containing protein [Vibrio rumoiensis]|uniref:DUF1294 domain-containing protein n=1 Tax=Vibrio rumoiensis TaxID=76258 RepID=UPI0013A590FE